MIVDTSPHGALVSFQMGYTYMHPSGEEGFGFAEAAAAVVATRRLRISQKYLEISDIDRSVFLGSYTIQVYFRWEGEEILIGQDCEFKRWDMSNCGNCQNRYMVRYKFPLTDLPGEVTDIKEEIVVRFCHHLKNDQDLEDIKFTKAPTLTIWSGNESNEPILTYTAESIP